MNDQTKSQKEGIIKDIGGGGIRFICRSELNRNDSIDCMMHLNGSEAKVITKILTVERTNNEVYGYEYRGSFESISSFDREKIIRFIFDEQRRALQKQKGL